MRTRTILRLAALSLLALLPVACEKNAATGKNQFQALSRQSEIAMGMEAQPQLTKEYGGKVNSPELQAYLSELGQRMAAVTEGDNPTLPWDFTMLDSDVINAFSTPGGKVYFSRGLVARMTNEAQLAGVLGHEIGHVTARHINDQMTNSGIASILVGAGSAAAGAAGYSGEAVGQIGQQVGGVVLLKYGRSQELEADRLGMRYMARLNYNPVGMRQVMEILKQAMAGGRQPELLSTHPYPENRIKQIDGLLAAEYAGTQNNPQYKLNESEFQTRCLSKLRTLPPPPKGKASLDLTPDRAFALNHPETWCLHCAAESHAMNK